MNRAHRKICAHKAEWPFLAAAAGNANDPFGGSVYLETEAGTRWYLLKTGSTGVPSDYGKVDWDSFFITTYGATGRSSPYEHSNLELISYDRWADNFRTAEIADEANEQQYGMPERVIRSVDGRYVGLSPVPDGVYRIYFSAWNGPTDLSAHSDTLVIPDKYVPVVYDLARYYLYLFKELPIQANASYRDYQMGLNEMVKYLIGAENKDIVDDRVRR